MEFIESNRGAQLMCFDGYIYRQDRANTSTVNWRCSERKCKGRITTALDPKEGDTSILTSAEHNHVPAPVKVIEKKLSIRIKKRCLTSSMSPSAIIREEMENVGEEASSFIKNNRNLAQIIRRCRKVEGDAEGFPSCPAYRSGFKVPPSLLANSSGEGILIYDSGPDDEDRILIYATQNMLGKLANHPQWLFDGTFKMSPLFLFQLFTIHALVEDTMVPCVYGLLPNKDRETYDRFWKALKSCAPNVSLSPACILSDFDVAAYASAQEHFPGASFRGSLFHLGQSLWWKIERFGLQPNYINNEEHRIKLKSLLALAFVPVASVGSAFEELADSYPSELQRVIDQFEDEFIGRFTGRKRRDPIFAHSFWNMHDTAKEGLHRSVNCLESWHTSFQSNLQCQNPSLWKLLKTIIEQNSLQESVYYQVISGSYIFPKDNKTKKMNNGLTALVNGMEALPILEFLKSCTFNIKLNY